MKSILPILIILFIPISGITDNNVNESESVKNVTVLDKFGTDTGMTEVELERFKASYLKRTNNDNSSYYNKIDFTKYLEYIQFGMDSTHFSFPLNKSYIKNTLFSQIIIIGKTYKRSKDFKGIDSLEIETILIGDEIIMNKLGYVPKVMQLYFGIDSCSEDKPIPGVRSIFFCSGSWALSKEKPWLQSLIESTISQGDNDLAYFSFLQFADSKTIEMYKKSAEAGERSWYILESFSQVVDNVKRVIEINDSKNFYKKTWK